LAKKFWPGSLSVLLPARANLPRQIQNEQGLVSLRWTPHPAAQRLSLQAQTPLVATSANISQQPAAAKPADLDQELLQLADCVLDVEPWPAGGLPSTLVQIIDADQLLLLRPGAVSSQQLQEAGFKLV
jgi:L-threonylcarbamoyladenylate synthase